MHRTLRLASILGICLLSACEDGQGADELNSSDLASSDLIDAGALALRGPGVNDFDAHGGDGGAPLQVRAGVITGLRIRADQNGVHQLTLRGYYPVHGDNINRGEPLVESGPYGGSGGAESPWQTCLDGWAAVGLQGNASTHLERVGLICSNLQTPSQIQTLPALGGTGGAYFIDQCKQDELLTGLDLRQGDKIESVRLYCQKK